MPFDTWNSRVKPAVDRHHPDDRATGGRCQMQPHVILKTLFEIGLSTPETIRPYHPRTRDRDDIGVLRCSHSGVILLDRIDHAIEATFTDRQGFSYWNAADRASALERTREDDQRRAALLTYHLAGRAWLDVGTGLGGILDLVGEKALCCAAVEPQPAAATALRDIGYTVYRDMADVPSNQFDTVTLFHVFEHLPDPVAFLAALRRVMVPGARLCIEVPHAGDVLLNRYDNAAFRDFTLWSEHLILHTRESLSRFVEKAGFAILSLEGIQRYPLANHLHWLARDRPGGHMQWPELRDTTLDSLYAERLAALNETDTLLLWARPL